MSTTPTFAAPDRAAGEPFDPLLAERHHLSPGLALAHRMAGGGAWETSADGAWITLSDGRRMLDLGSYGVTLLGHRHPAVTAAVAAQLARLPTSSRSLANDVTPRLAHRLIEALGHAPLRRCWFGCNGADAVDLALKLARASTGRPRVLAAVGAFHGKTLGALSATWYARYRDVFAAHLAATTHVEVTDLDAVERELAAGDVAALIVEPVQGEGGVRPVPREVLVGWGELARRHGSHLIADEVQTGFHRCGGMSVALDSGAEVSAVLLGKALGGGVAPISAVVGTEELFGPLVRDPFLHTTTFSGHPLSAAAALSALDAVADLPDRGPAFAAILERLRRAHPELIADVRGRGHLWGVELNDSHTAGVLLLELAAAGVVVSPCLGRPEVIRLLPPAVLSDADLEAAEDRLREALHATCRTLRREGGRPR
ncbi:aspartate aminotransferase family protein [Spirillospora sp. NPDC047279]|uniref:aspartate aminotransferase family protein n=1 Tax=Spirillospora sp. NPDC047279 TaxID=3155478 RepID=UPI0033E54F50